MEGKDTPIKQKIKVMQNHGFDISSSTKVYILQDAGVKWPKKHGFEYSDVRFESWLRESQYKN